MENWLVNPVERQPVGASRCVLRGIVLTAQPCFEGRTFVRVGRRCYRNFELGPETGMEGSLGQCPKLSPYEPSDKGEMYPRMDDHLFLSRKKLRS